MPIYEYQCETCEKLTEAIQRLDEPPLALCPHCGGPLRKLMSAPSFQFKGTGWYVTDYAGKSEPGRDESAKKEGHKKEGGSSSAGSEGAGDGKSGSSAKGDEPRSSSAS